MKSKKEIEQLAEQYTQDGIYLSDSEKQQTEITYMTGYNQCKKDMADKKYTIKEVERYHDIRATQGIKNANNYINSLNKQD